jgi:hypothetical protein
MKGVRSWVAAALVLCAAGCGKPVLRLADASLGDYYTEEEYQKLSEEQRAEYCNELATQRETFQADISDAGEALAGLRLGASERRAEADSLSAVAERLEERVLAERTAARDPAGAGGAAGATSGGGASIYVVKRGDSLWRISGLPGTLGRSADWGRIYEANRKQIADPDLIYPGQELTIPR